MTAPPSTSWQKAARRVAHEGARRSRLNGAVLVLVVLACAPALSLRAPPPEWGRMIASEEAILQVTSEVKRLDHSVLNLQLPDESTRGLFGDLVEILDLTSVELTSLGPLGTVGLSSGGDLGSQGDAGSGGDLRSGGDAGTRRQVSRAELALWRPLLDQVEFFEHAAFHVIRGRLLVDESDRPETGESDRLETEVGFEALARVAERRIWVRANVTIVWAGGPSLVEGGPPTWSIVGWRSGALTTMSVDRPLFAEVLDHALEPEALAEARRSIHEELIVEYMLDPEAFEAPTPFFEIPSADRHPGLAVVDLDRDGFDDVYVLARWGPNQFFRNRGNGTFEEIAEQIGLDIEGHTSSALFADFDNDGDSDVFLGRTLQPSVYMINEGGRFVDRSVQLVDGPLPALASAVSAADYDNDGLLDLYVSTFAAAMRFRGEAQTAFLPDGDALELFRLRLSGEDHVMRNRFGPPNVLFKNLGGGRLGRVEDTPVKLFKNSYQSTWGDYDNDGDMDLYVANDFAANNLYRNDGVGGFTDVTEETGTADMGFGMGASWGDFDEDGLQDLYVTNMYSKAGLRITAQLDEAAPNFERMAHGNTLFRNDGDGFERVSSLERPGLLVEAAGWGWGSQFVDLDNDSDLDLYALSGYYTAPPAVALPIDI